MGAVSSSRRGTTVIQHIEEKTSTPITSYIVDHILDDKKMAALTCSNTWHENGLDHQQRDSTLPKTFKQNTRAGRLESTPAKPVTLARMVEDLACQVHASPSLHNQSMAAKVTALKTVASHLLATRWSEGSRSTSEPVPRALAPRLGLPSGTIIAAVPMVGGVGASATAAATTKGNATPNSAQTETNGTSAATSSPAPLSQHDVLQHLEAQMQQTCGSLAFEDAARRVMEVASLPLTLRFVSTLLAMDEAHVLPAQVLEEVKKTMGTFAPPPKKCSMVFGPFYDDVLLGSPHSIVKEVVNEGGNEEGNEEGNEVGNGSKQEQAQEQEAKEEAKEEAKGEATGEAKQKTSHSIVAWFVPNPRVEQSVSFSLLNAAKKEQLKCEIVWTPTGMGSVHIHLPSLSTPFTHPVLSHLVNGTVVLLWLVVVVVMLIFFLFLFFFCSFWWVWLCWGFVVGGNRHCAESANSIAVGC
jgi:hypothetical protein